ncbi:MAG: hypothetical protein ACLGPL_09635 [Acidobacteriota bacterium]
MIALSFGVGFLLGVTAGVFILGLLHMVAERDDHIVNTSNPLTRQV